MTLNLVVLKVAKATAQGIFQWSSRHEQDHQSVVESPLQSFPHESFTEILRDLECLHWEGPSNIIWMRLCLEKRISLTPWQGPGQFLQPSDKDSTLESHCGQREEPWVLNPCEQSSSLSICSVSHLRRLSWSDDLWGLLQLRTAASPARTVWTNRPGLLQQQHFGCQGCFGYWFVFWVCVCLHFITWTRETFSDKVILRCGNQILLQSLRAIWFSSEGWSQHYVR